MSVSKDDLALMGIDLTESDPLSRQADAAEMAFDLNDPDTAALLASFEALKPTAPELAAKITADQAAATEPSPEVGADAPPDPAATSTANSAAPGDQRTGTGTGTGAGTEAGTSTSSDEAAATDQTVISDTFLVDMGDGQTATLDTARAQQLLGLEQWVHQLPADTRNAMSAIEDGRAVAIERAQYEAFQAWMAAGQPAPGTSRPSSVQPSTLPELDEFADDTTRALYAEVQNLRATQDQQQQQYVAQQADAYTAQYDAHVNARAQIFDTEFTATATSLGLSSTELNAALEYAGRNMVIRQVNDELTVRNPITGDIMREADPQQVARVTLDRAMYAIPELRQRLIDQEVQARLDTDTADVAAINAKRSRASSLASTPAAANSTPADVRNMTHQQREAAMANELRAVLAA